MKGDAMLGGTQASVVKVMQDLNWWIIADVYRNEPTLGSLKTAASAMARLAARGYLESRVDAGHHPLRSQYRLTEAGIDAGIRLGVIS